MSPSRAGVRVVGSGAPDDDGDDDGPDEPVGSEGGGGPDEPRRLRRDRQPGAWPTPLLVVAGVIALVGIFGSVFFYGKYHRLQHRADLQNQVAKASSDFLSALTDFNANTIDAQFNKVQGVATGDFKTQALQFFSSDVRQALAKAQATSRGQIRSLYVESINGNSASVYADVDQTIANLNFSAPEQDELRVVITMVKQGGRWLVSELTVLSGPTVPTAPAGGTPNPTTTVPSGGAPASSVPPTTAG